MGEIRFSSAVGADRPSRLKESTRELCREYLSGSVGNGYKSTLFITLDDVKNFEKLNMYEKHNLAVKRIAEEAEVIVRNDELLVGSASLFAAAWAWLPAQYSGNFVVPATNHTTYQFRKVLERGFDDLEREVIEKKESVSDKYGVMMLDSVLSAVEGLKIWHGRYMKKIEQLISDSGDENEVRHLTELRDSLKDMPFKTPKTFRQAVQSLFFTVQYTRLTGNFSGIGKIDRMLEPYLSEDLKKGIITEDEARELIAHFLIKGCEWLTYDIAGGGDGMYFQNIVLAGIDSEGKETAGTVTRLILEVVEELPIGVWPIGVRLNSKSPQWLLRKCAEVTRHGVGVVAVYDEETVINSFKKYGFSHENSVDFSNDGCWETIVQGKTLFGYYPMDALPSFQKDTLGLDETDKPNRVFASYGDLYASAMENIHKMIDRFNELADGWCRPVYNENPYSVSGIASLLVDGCVEKATDYWQGGPEFNILSPHLGGLCEIANDLYAIKKLVYEEKKITLDELVTALKNNWDGNESLMKYARNNYLYYGNDNGEVDGIMADIVGDFADYVMKTPIRNAVIRTPGVSTFGRQVSEWFDNRTATASGKRKNDILSGNISPTPMTDFKGPTAVIKSCCACPLEKLTGGTALDINLEPSSIRGEDGIGAIMLLYRGFVNLCGLFMHINVVDPAELEDAVDHPEKHMNLTVRVSGWSSRFVTIEKNWQQMIIERAKNGAGATE